MSKLTAEDVATRLAGLTCGGYGPEQLQEAIALIEQYGLQCEERWTARIKLLEDRITQAKQLLRSPALSAAPVECTCAERSTPPSLDPSAHYHGCPFRRVLRERGGG